jgi:tripeptide aminopeptidase
VGDAKPAGTTQGESSPFATIEATYELHLTAYEVNENSPVVIRFREACEALGLKGELKPTFGGADNHQFNANGIEGIVLSCGMENVHTTGEYIKVSNLVSGSKLVEKIILP